MKSAGETRLGGPISMLKCSQTWESWMNGQCAVQPWKAPSSDPGNTEPYSCSVCALWAQYKKGPCGQ